MCMKTPKIPAPAPAPAPPPVLEQVAPKSATGSDAKKKRTGLSRYKIDTQAPTARTASLGGVPMKTGV